MSKEAKKKEKKVSILYEQSDFVIEKEILRKNGVTEFVEVMRPEYNSHAGKCIKRSCETFGVSYIHLRKAFASLSGRRIDGILFNDLVGRFGFFDGEMTNRATLAARYKVPVMAIEIATDRLIDIVQNENIKAAYAEYMNEHKQIADKKIEDHIRVGGELDD